MRPLDTMLRCRASRRLCDRLAAVAGRLPLSRSAILRSALAIGLDMIEDDPACILRRRERGVDTGKRS